MEVNIETEEFTNIYRIDSEIGRGKFAVVKQCTHLKSGRLYAAKKIRKTRKGKDCRDEVIQEADMLRVTLSHPHFVDLIEVYENRSEMIIVTELMRGGELFQFLTSEDKLSEVHTQNILRQVLSGLSFLHSKQIAHLDIKPQNILLMNNSLDCKVKLCDLGLARNVKGVECFEIIGTADYLAPEILDYQRLSVACDMWSTGVLVYVMLSGCSPFAGDTNQETYLNISQVNLDFPDEYFSIISEHAIKFIEKLLIKDPSCRLKVDECLEDVWLVKPCPPSPVEHEPVKRIRFEDDEDHIIPDECSFNGLPSMPDSDNITSSSASPTIPEPPPIVVFQKTKSVQKKVEQFEKITQESEKSKENLKSRRSNTPVSKRNTPSSSPHSSLSDLSPRSGVKTTLSNNHSLSSCSKVNLIKPTSFSFENDTNIFTNHLPSTSHTDNNIPNIPERYNRVDTPERYNLDNEDNPHNIDNINNSSNSDSPIQLSPSSSSPKLQTSELTPHLSRARFWKDTPTEPSGIPV